MYSFKKIISYVFPIEVFFLLSKWQFLSHSSEDFLDPQLNNLPRDTFVFHCPLPNTTNFNMKLFKGNEVACDLYLENEAIIKNKTEFCDPVYSSGCEVIFLLSNLQNKHSDTYTCYLEILTPLYHHCKANEIYLHIKGEFSETLKNVQINKYRMKLWKWPKSGTGSKSLPVLLLMLF